MVSVPRSSPSARPESGDCVSASPAVQSAAEEKASADFRIPSTLSENLNKRKIPKLDALRAASAGIVVLYHLGYDFFPAGVGVLVFFVISGFLITWLLLEEWDSSGAISLRHFYFRRTMRIFPAFYCFWLVSILVWRVLHHPVPWGQAAAMFFYVGNYYQGLNHYPESGLSHAWSLGVEEQFYLIWPALFLMLVKHHRRLLKVSCGLILFVWVYRIVLVLLGAPGEYIYTAFDTRFDHLLIGCVVAIALRYGYFSRLWQTICAKTVYCLFPLLGLILSTVAFHAGGETYRDSVGFILDPLLVAILMVQLIASRSRLLAWMDSGLLIFLGTISYSVYLYHELATHIALRIVGRWPRPILMVVILLATYLVASVSYFAVEKPFLRLRSRIDSRLWGTLKA